jgi:diguanylate cyclase (GGDEF)-like protein
MLAWGVGRISESSEVHPAWPQVAPDTNFVPIGPWNTDGLIVFAPLFSKIRSRYLQQVSAAGFPVLYIATGEAEPAITADNEGGIRQAVAHLVDHGHRRIAFVAGDPRDPGDSAYRLQAYRAALKEFGLESDPQLIDYGEHSQRAGHAAMQRLFDSKTRFTAVVASDDASPIGAMQAIQEAGLRIPHDLAIIGFDDQPDAIAQVPPLTSIHVPLTEIGYHALKLMLDHIERRVPLKSVQIPTRLSARQSCGCLPETVLSASRRMPSASVLSAERSEENVDQVWNCLVDEMVAALPERALHLGMERSRRLCTSLTETFLGCLGSGNLTDFQSALAENLQEAEQADEDVNAWQEIITILRRNMNHLPFQWTPIKIREAEDLLHQARTVISESAQRVDRRHLFQEDTIAYPLGLLTARLSASLDEHQAVQILERYLLEVGIRHCRVMRFEPQGSDEVAWSIVIGPEADDEPLRFLSREFPPPGLYPPDTPLNLTLLPLVFQDEALGYVVFEAANLKACAAIAQQLAATFKVSRLHAQVRELSLTDGLTGLHNRRYFDLFLAKETERCLRHRRTMAIMMIDLDNLKAYNDQYGHPAGDEALKCVARCLEAGCRKMDMVTRYGGDEFAIILPESGASDVLQAAERIRAAIAALSELKCNLTISVVVAILQGEGVSADVLLQHTDQALYEAKNSGRNRVCVYQEE